ncbi:tetraacyldisaccharide 4'-kinase [Pedobacter nanyangensis]|uniref:tetraacyldisaccharide 4'-kinase n=1 Tax=Pedobacter nanyangensis TaxID=1562389 RepID=UPI000DE25B73|nr:tetraacyldisaccharide 4'-kinase [Pedobacter nanyangensis]
MLKHLRPLLLPFNLVYALVVYVRNKFYDWGVFKSTSFNLPIICIGNLAVGGSGKTPTTEYLVHLLSHYKIAILSRGYGRKTSGFILAGPNATAETIGDEPLQYYHKFSNVTVAVCEDRVAGINRLKANHDLILLDDAFQHRKVKAGFNVLLFEFAKLQKMQWLLPAGNLREPFSGVKRAQAVLVTKSPAEITSATRKKMLAKLQLQSSQQLAFSHINYQKLKHLYTAEETVFEKDQHLFLLTGIANTAPLMQYLAEKQLNVHPFEYPDHHCFTEKEIAQLVTAYRQHQATKKIIVTTEKDGQRLLTNNLRDLLLNLPVYYLPIAVGINAEDKIGFDQKILDYVASTKRLH